MHVVVCRSVVALWCRDLNPNNVLVYNLDPGNISVKVADFGLSRELEAGVVATMTSA